MSERAVYVFDSFAILAHLQDESSQGRVLDLLRQARPGSCRLLMSIINLGEVIYLVERRRGLRAAQAVLAVMDALPMEILPADRESVLAAAHLKAHYPIALADAFAAAAAQAHGGVLLTGDAEFESLTGLIEIEWLPRQGGRGG